jgi:hypothetical protein
LTTQVQSTGLRIWYDSGSTRRALQFVTNGVVAMDLGRTAGGTLDAGFYHPVVFNDAVQVNNTSSTPFSIGTSSGDILTDSNANLGLNDGNLWLGDMAHNAGHGVAKVIMSDQGSPSVSPPSNHGLVWYDDAAGALKLRTDTGLIRQMLHAGCRVYHSAAQSIGSGTSTALSFNSERHDSDGFHSTSSNTNRITIPAGMGGKYVISGQVRFAANATGFREVSIRVGGATTIAIQDTLAVGGVPTILSITTVYELAAGDYVELLAYQNSGGALDVDSSGNYSPEFSIAAVG